VQITQRALNFVGSMGTHARHLIDSKALPPTSLE